MSCYIIFRIKSLLSVKYIFRSQMFYKIGALRKFANFIGKHLCWCPCLVKLQALRASLLWRDSTTSLFMWILQNFEEYFFYWTPQGDCFCNVVLATELLLFHFFKSYDSYKKNSYKKLRYNNINDFRVDKD